MRHLRVLTPRPRFTGPPAPMTWRFWMSCSTKARTSKQPAQSSGAARLWLTPWHSGSGRRRDGWSNAGPHDALAGCGAWTGSAGRGALCRRARTRLPRGDQRLLVCLPRSQRATAEYLHGRGAALNWVGDDDLTALDAAGRSGAHELVAWLSGLGAKSASDIG